MSISLPLERGCLRAGVFFDSRRLPVRQPTGWRRWAAAVVLTGVLSRLASAQAGPAECTTTDSACEYGVSTVCCDDGGKGRFYEKCRQWRWSVYLDKRHNHDQFLYPQGSPFCSPTYGYYETCWKRMPPSIAHCQLPSPGEGPIPQLPPAAPEPMAPPETIQPPQPDSVSLPSPGDTVSISEAEGDVPASDAPATPRQLIAPPPAGQEGPAPKPQIIPQQPAAPTSDSRPTTSSVIRTSAEAEPFQQRPQLVHAAGDRPEFTKVHSVHPVQFELWPANENPLDIVWPLNSITAGPRKPATASASVRRWQPRVEPAASSRDLTRGPKMEKPD